MKTIASAKLTQEGCDIILNAAVEKADRFEQNREKIQEFYVRLNENIQSQLFELPPTAPNVPHP